MFKDPNLILKEEVIAYWRRAPMNRPVKITSYLRDPMFWTEGFITCYKFVGGHTLAEAEQVVGYPPGELRGGAYFYEFIRLPQPYEFELKGYSQCPDGKPWTPASKYPPGLGAAQWTVAKNTFIPSRLAAIVKPGSRFP